MVDGGRDCLGPIVSPRCTGGRRPIIGNLEAASSTFTHTPLVMGIGGLNFFPFRTAARGKAATFPRMLANEGPGGLGAGAAGGGSAQGQGAVGLWGHGAVGASGWGEEGALGCSQTHQLFGQEGEKDGM